MAEPLTCVVTGANRGIGLAIGTAMQPASSLFFFYFFPALICPQAELKKLQSSST
jgi:hypothetical protein